MFYKMPVTVYQGENCVWNHRAELASFGSKALLVTGRHSAAACGALNDVKRALDDQKVGCEVFSAVEENPSVETVLLARKKGLAAKCDFVIGIGGGSPMDAAKAVSMLMRHPEEGWEALYDPYADADALPIVEIPTTCGTGSEVTAVSVLTRHDIHTKQSVKHRLFPDLALLDGRYLANAPRAVICNTAVDAMAHMFESCINAKATDFSRVFVREGLAVWRKNMPVLLGERKPTVLDCHNLLLASCLGGMAIAHTGTSLPHGLSYILTYDLHMPHGVAVGYFQEGYLSEADPQAREELLSWAGFADLTDLHDFYRAACGAHNVPDSTLSKAYQIIAEQPERLAAASYKVDRETLKRIVFYQTEK